MTKAERTRQFIIEKAAPIFNRKGIAGTSMADIMEATKLAKGGLYGNFESKEEICLESFKYLIKNLTDDIGRRIVLESSATGKLFALLDFYVESAAKNGNSGCPMLNFGTEADDTNPLLQKQVSDSISRYRTRIADILKKGQHDGEFAPELDTEKLALKIFSMIEGGVLVSKVQQNPQHMAQVVNMLKEEIRQLSN
ncbi:MAG TPA: TetR/AcrR family transcriptional regulator [Mucilaginibacter sp.]